MPASGGDLGQTGGAAATHMKKNLPAQARPLALLAEINYTLAVARNVRAGLQRALEILAQQYRVLQAGVVLIDPDSGQLKIEASEGLTAEGQRATWGVDPSPAA